MSNTPFNRKRKREEFEKDAKELLTCPICFEYLSFPTIQCTKGHLICLACYKNILLPNKICPQCRCRYDPHNDTNHFLNQMLTYFECKCSYASYGCTAKLNLANRPAHERNCIHNREVACPVGDLTFDVSLKPGKKSCWWRGRLHKFQDHLETKHGHQVEEFKSNRPHLRFCEARQTYDRRLPYLSDKLIKIPNGYVYVVIYIEKEIKLYVRPLTLKPKLKSVQIVFSHKSNMLAVSKSLKNTIEAEFLPYKFELSRGRLEDFYRPELGLSLYIFE